MYLEDSGFGNHILYKMCQDYPLNNNHEIIGGKLWLIGRAYAASVERKAGANFDWSPLKSAIADSNIDSHLAKCKKIKRVELENLPQVLLAHKELTMIFKKTTKLEKRSLASKYLHFHAPSAFFIYDSMAVSAVQNQVKIDRGFNRNSAYDLAYEDFCHRCIKHREALEAQIKFELSPRKVDSELLAIAKAMTLAKRANT